MTFSAAEALAKGDAAAFVEYVQANPDAPAQYANYATMIDKALDYDADPNTAGIQHDRSLDTFAKEAFEAIKEQYAATNAAASAGAMDFKGMIGQVLGGLGDALKMIFSGDLMGGINKLTEAFNFNAGADNAAALQTTADASATDAMTALTNAQGSAPGVASEILNGFVKVGANTNISGLAKNTLKP